MKNILTLYLILLSVLSKILGRYRLQNEEEIMNYLDELTTQSIDFELDENCSILVSPTRNKIIVYHHSKYFQKFAFSSSYNNVKNEASIYKLLNKPLDNFKVSKFYDFVNIENELCSFKLMSYKNIIKNDINIPLALAEMFKISEQNNYLFTNYLDNLKNKYFKSSIECNTINNVLSKLRINNKNKFISFGLVHHDFKHWNINTEAGLLIYDFEEAITNGLPLEDLLNYYIDPIIGYMPPKDIAKKIFETKNIQEYKYYLKKLKIDLDFHVLLFCYILERILFYTEIKNFERRINYIDLLQYLYKINKGLY